MSEKLNEQSTESPSDLRNINEGYSGLITANNQSKAVEKGCSGIVDTNTNSESDQKNLDSK